MGCLKPWSLGSRIWNMFLKVTRWKKRLCIILNIEQNLSFLLLSLCVHLFKNCPSQFLIQLSQCFLVRNSVFFLTKTKTKVWFRIFIILLYPWGLYIRCLPQIYLYNFECPCGSWWSRFIVISHETSCKWGVSYSSSIQTEFFHM